MERKALIFNVQKYNMYDGPGIRTIVFFKGCPLRCKWCANPEGLERKVQVMFKKNSCVDCGLCVQACPVGIHTISKETGKHEVRRDIDCTGCRKCIQVEVTDTRVLSRVLDSMGIDYNIISHSQADIFAQVPVTRLVLALHEEGCDVLSVRERDESLESYYISLVGGDRNE